MAGSLKMTLPRAHDPFPGSEVSEGWHDTGVAAEEGVASAEEEGVASAREAGQLGCGYGLQGQAGLPVGHSGRPVP